MEETQKCKKFVVGHSESILQDSVTRTCSVFSLGLWIMRVSHLL